MTRSLVAISQRPRYELTSVKPVDFQLRVLPSDANARFSGTPLDAVLRALTDKAAPPGTKSSSRSRTALVTARAGLVGARGLIIAATFRVSRFAKVSARPRGISRRAERKRRLTERGTHPRVVLCAPRVRSPRSRSYYARMWNFRSWFSLVLIGRNYHNLDC
jgi:hypothetical protein